MNLIEKTNNLNNNFDFLRFLAASSVLLIHCFILFGVKDPSFIKYLPAGVPVFFIISGFLITKSWTDNPDLSVFLKKRVLRICPALIIVVLFAALILGPALTTLDLKTYFTDVEFWKYLRDLFVYKIYFTLPGVFENNPYPAAVNGSLWTLPIEFFMYILVAIFGLLNILNKKWLYISIFILSIFLIFHVYVGDLYNKNFIFCEGRHLFRLLNLFFLGSCLYTYRSKIIFSFPLFLAAILIWIIGVNTAMFDFVQFITLPYIVIYFAYAKIPLINNWGKYGDFSYGIYIWAFPIQQTITYLYKDYLNIYSYMAITFVLTLFASFLSYNFIEKPALKLKKYNFTEVFTKAL